MSQTTLYALIGIVGILLIGMSVFGLRYQHVTNASEFLMARRRVNPGFMTASFIATWMWGADIAAVPQTVYYSGVAGIWYYGLPVLLGGMFAALVLHRVRKVFPATMTYQHFLLKRLDGKNHIVFVLIGMYTMVIAAMLQIRVGGDILGAMAGIDPLFVSLLLAIIVAVYTTVAGLWASMLTDYVQFATAAILTLIVMPIIILSAGGPTEIYNLLQQNWGGATDVDRLSFSGVDGAHMYQFFLPFVFVWGVWGVASMSIWQRGLAVRRDKISRTLIFGSIGWFSTIPMYGLVGLVALAHFPELLTAEADKTADAGIMVYNEFLGGASQIVFALTLIGLLTSTADSALAALSSLVSKDIYQEHINPKASQKARLGVARWSVPFWAAVVMLTVWGLHDVGFLQLVWINGIGFSAVFFPLLYSLFSQRVSANAIFATALVVLATLGYWFFFSGAVDLSKGTFGDLVLMYIIGYGEALVLPPILSVIWPTHFDFEALSRSESEEPAAYSASSG